MCGRFTLTSTPEALAERFELDAPLRFEPRYNIAPGQDVVAVRAAAGGAGRCGVWLRWGLVPHWAKDPAIGSRMINARAETVAEKPAFRDALRHRRCVVPADGFYEWAPGAHGRQPHHVHRPDRGLFAMAALWERWRDADDTWLETCTVITRDAAPPVSELHDRMPVILPPSQLTAWLDPDREDPGDALALLAGDAESLALHPVSTRVNRTAWDDPGCLEPVPALPRQQGLFP